MNLLITICARGGSKGIPRKNIRSLAGKPLIHYTINHANNFKKWFENEKYGSVFIALSTDDDEIIEVANDGNLKTDYKRPEFLANDTAGKLDAIKDVLLFTENQENIVFDFVLDLDVSSPMRTLEDLKESFSIFKKNEDAYNLFSVNNAHKNPYFNMVEKNEKGFYELSKKSEVVLSRQSAPKVFEMNASFYFYRRSFFDSEPLYLFNHSLIYEMRHACFDLDEIIDFEFLEYLLSNNKLSFSI